MSDPTEEARQQAAAQELALAQRQAASAAAAAAKQKKQADYTRLHGMLKLDNFDGDSGGGLLLKGVDVETGGGLARDSGGKLALKLADDDDTLRSSVATPESGLALKFGDDDLKPQGTRAVANNSGAANSPAPNTDPMVVDARNVPSGLPKAVDDAIAAVYANAPAGVSDRVRKGFQAVMEGDWKVAKAWFEDALNHDPGNAGLKSFVALTDSPPSSYPQTTIPNRSLPNDAIPPNAAGQHLEIETSQRQLVEMLRETGMNHLSVGDEKGAQKSFNDADFLSMGLPAEPSKAPTPPPTFIIGKDGQLIQVPANTDQKSPTFVKGKAGELIQVPQPSDIKDLFPGTTPAAPPKPAPVKAPEQAKADAIHESALHNLNLTSPADAQAASDSKKDTSKE